MRLVGSDYKIRKKYSYFCVMLKELQHPGPWNSIMFVVLTTRAMMLKGPGENPSVFWVLL